MGTVTSASTTRRVAHEDLQLALHRADGIEHPAGA